MCTFAFKLIKLKKNLLLGITYEVLWFAFAFAAAYLMVFSIRASISSALYYYIFFSIAFIITYFRFVTFMSYSVLMKSVFVKIGLFIINVPLFFYLLKQYFTYSKVFDDYNLTLPANVFQHIKSGTELDDLLYLKQVVIFSGVIAMMLVLLLQIRIVYAIFKQRQLDKYIFKKNINTIQH
jgi:hypothetical protein